MQIALILELKTINKTYKMENIFIEELTTKNGIDKLELMVKFMPLLITPNESEKKIKNNYNSLKSFLVSQLNRGISLSEEDNLLSGIVDYLETKEATPERMKAMEYLFNLEFINN